MRRSEVARRAVGLHLVPLVNAVAALKFIKNGGQEAIITTPRFIKEAVLNGKGTHIIP